MSMKRWLKQSKAPAAVERVLEQAARAASGTEVDTCDECGKPGFVGQMVDLSTQDRSLLLCPACHAYRLSLRAMESAHEPTQQYACLCGWPIESAIHERITSDD